MRKNLITFCLMLLCITGVSAQFAINPKGQVFMGDSTKFKKEPIISYRIDESGDIVPVIHDPLPLGDRRASRLALNVTGGISLTDSIGYLIMGTPQVGKTTDGITLIYPASPSFYVKTTGEVYAKEGLVQSSDETLKKNIRTIENPLEKIGGLRGVSYSFKDESPAIATMSATSEQEETESDRIGLLAQDVEKVFPQAVRLLPDSTKGVMYADLVAVLVEGIKALDAQVEALRQQVEALLAQEQEESPKKSAPSSSSSSSLREETVLYQNTPNPFSQATDIAYRIPQGTNASIGIYDLNGLQLKRYPLTDSSGKVTVQASELQAGIYVYSLVIDGKEADSKRMVLTE